MNGNYFLEVDFRKILDMFLICCLFLISSMVNIDGDTVIKDGALSLMLFTNATFTLFSCQ